jgi:methionyl-tRNA synthetase
VDATVSRIAQRRAGLIPRAGTLRDAERAIVAAASSLGARIGHALDQFDFPAGIREVAAATSVALAYAESRGVLALGAEAEEPRRLDTVLYVLAEACRLLAHNLRPLLPGATARIEARLGLAQDGPPTSGQQVWGLTQPESRVQPGEPLFPRLALPRE